jgi:hypothetical protein
VLTRNNKGTDLAKANISKRKVYYRKTEFTTKQKRTLQQLTADALAQNQLAQSRSEAIGSQANELRLIGRYKEVNGFLCGQLVTFQRGSYQTVIGDDPSAKTLSLSAVTPPVIDDVQHQYVPGVLYFALLQDHVVVVQSAAVRTSAFEQHLAWLLRTKSGILGNQEGFVLKDEPQPATKTRIRKSHVKSVSLGRPLMTESVINDDDGTKDVQTGKTTKFQPDGMFINFFKDFFSDSAQFEKLGLENGLFDGNLEVWIEIRYPKRQRSKSEDSVKLLDNLGIALRDIDEEHAKLKLGDGSVVQGKDLRISSDLEVKVNEKGLPDEDDIFNEMCSWLKEQIKNGVIAPD